MPRERLKFSSTGSVSARFLPPETICSLFKCTVLALEVKTEINVPDGGRFAIRYHNLSGSFTLVDISTGSGTFLQVKRPFRLLGRNIISFNDSHMLATVERFEAK
jgi:hypothetical protein